MDNNIDPMDNQENNFNVPYEINEINKEKGRITNV